MLSIYFSREEFKCNCGECNCDTVDAELLEILEDVRDVFRAPVIITSGHRCEAYNKKIGGSPNSQHLYGRAADIVVEGYPAHEVYEYLDEQYPDKYGMGKYNEFTHIDTRSNGPARW